MVPDYRLQNEGSGYLENLSIVLGCKMSELGYLSQLMFMEHSLCAGTILSVDMHLACNNSILMSILGSTIIPILQIKSLM